MCIVHAHDKVPALDLGVDCVLLKLLILMLYELFPISNCLRRDPMRGGTSVVRGGIAPGIFLRASGVLDCVNGAG